MICLALLILSCYPCTDLAGQQQIPQGLQCYVVQWPVLWKVKSEEDPCHSGLWSSQITFVSNEQKEGNKNKMFLTQSNKNMEWSQAYFCAFSYIDALKSAVPCSLPSKSCYSHHMVQHNSPDWLPITDTVLVLHVSVVSPGMFFHTPMCSCFSGVQLTGEVEQAAQRILAAWTVMIAQTLDSYCSGSQRSRTKALPIGIS